MSFGNIWENKRIPITQQRTDISFPAYTARMERLSKGDLSRVASKSA